MKILFRSVIFCFFCAVLRADLSLSAASAQGPDESPVHVHALVVDFQPFWVWSPPVTNGGRPVFGGTRVKMTVTQPAGWAKREFWIEFSRDGEALARIGLSFGIGRTYSMSLPRDFLEGKYGSIPEWAVGALARQPDPLPESLTFPSPFIPVHEPCQPPVRLEDKLH